MVEAPRKLFVGGLSYATTHGDLREHFSAFGPVSKVVVIKDAITGSNRGFGFVTFVYAESVEKALGEGSKHVIDNKDVDVKLGVTRTGNKFSSFSSGAKMTKHRSEPSIKGERSPVPDSLSRFRSDSNHLMFSKSCSTSDQGNCSGRVASTRRFSDVSPSSNVSSDSSDPSSSFSKSSLSDPLLYTKSNNKLFVGGLHYATRDPEFLRYFEDFGTVISSKVLFNRQTGKSRGFGFVTFEDSKNVKKVMAKASHVIDNKEVEIKVAVPRTPNSTSSLKPNAKSTEMKAGAKTKGAISDASFDLEAPSAPSLTFSPTPAPSTLLASISEPKFVPIASSREKIKLNFFKQSQQSQKLWGKGNEDFSSLQCGGLDIPKDFFSQLPNNSEIQSISSFAAGFHGDVSGVFGVEWTKNITLTSEFAADKPQHIQLEE